MNMTETSSGSMPSGKRPTRNVVLTIPGDQFAALGALLANEATAEAAIATIDECEERKGKLASVLMGLSIIELRNNILGKVEQLADRIRAGENMEGNINV